MKSLYIGGMSGSGKTAIALGLALKLREEGINAGYFKPLDPSRTSPKKTDEDVILLQQVLNLPYDASFLNPIHTGFYNLTCCPPKDPSPYIEKIKSIYQELSAKVDVMIIDGSLSPYTGASMGLDAISLAKLLSSTMVYVIRLENDFSIDKTIFYNEHFRLAGVPVLGNIFNNVSRTLLDKTKGVYAPILENLNFPVMGIIPQKVEISAPTVREYSEALGGELLTGNDAQMGRIVEEIVVGSMTIESALTYLRRAPNKAVITGGDRSDMAITALETSTSVLILTGGLYPDVSVLNKAIEKKVPVILVHYDTYTTIERMFEVSRRIHPADTAAVKIAQENISSHCNWKLVIDYINQ